MIRALLVILLLATSALAVQPDEILADAALEARARALSKDLRCLVCRNENIDDSNAELARDLRLLVRERLTTGDSDEEVLDFVVARYGEYVLLTPRGTGSNVILYAAGPAMLFLALLIGGLYLRGRARQPSEANQALSAEEQAALDRILND